VVIVRACVVHLDGAGESIAHGVSRADQRAGMAREKNIAEFSCACNWVDLTSSQLTKPRAQIRWQARSRKHAQRDLHTCAELPEPTRIGDTISICVGCVGGFRAGQQVSK
jgi:hypothetical protein